MKTVYILVEGEPDSPELPFLERLIGAIIINNHKLYDVQLFEVGGCTALANGSVAKTFYKLSSKSSGNGNFHEKIPVLAIADSDYRINFSKVQKSNTELIKYKKAKIIFWKRHEWENYLLDETQLIADFAKGFPIKVEGMKTKYHKKAGASVQKEELDHFLFTYFSGKIVEEFKECLKFNIGHFRYIIDKSYSRISLPSENDFESMKSWFLDYQKGKMYPLNFSHDLPSIFNDILSEYQWDKWLETSFKSQSEKDELIQFALENFRGKEAFEGLVGSLRTKGFSIPSLSEDKSFIEDLLKQLERKGSNSAIYKDLESIILAELP